MSMDDIGHQPTVTVAGIDCGTNSIRLKISKVDTGNHVEDIVPRVLRVVRLGQDVDKTREFAPVALERTYAAAQEFAQILGAHHVDGLRFVATSATRDAHNREEFEDGIERILGVRPEVISGVEEADLSFLGATSVVDVRALEPPYLVADLGGGSTELVLGGRGVHAFDVEAAYSMNIGCVRVTERHLLDDPPTSQQIVQASADIETHIDEALRSVPVGQAHTVIGVSGTITTLAALTMGLTQYDHVAIDGARIGVEDVAKESERILAMTHEQRSALKTIHPGRVDVIDGGALVWTHVLQRVAKATKAHHGIPVTSFIASEHGLLDGVVLDYGHRLLHSLPSARRNWG